MQITKFLAGNQEEGAYHIVFFDNIVHSRSHRVRLGFRAARAYKKMPKRYVCDLL